MRFIFVSTLVTSLACGSQTIEYVHHNPVPTDMDSDAGVDESPDATMTAVPDTSTPENTTFPAFTVDAPQSQNSGGRVLKNPKVVPIFFKNDDATSVGKIEDFLAKLPSSTYWAATTSEYGVGPLTVGAAVKLAEAAPATITDQQIDAWLESKLTSQSLPAYDLNTIFVIIYPSGTAITQQMGASCTDFGGYHSISTASGAVYAVMPRCATFDNLNGIEGTTGGLSHELVEASTDPDPDNPAYAHVDSNHAAWELLLIGELGDLCTSNANAFYAPLDLGYVVQRTWSNKSIKAGHDPCVPLDTSGPYFNAMPVLTDTVALGGGGFTTKGVKIAVGQSKTIDVQLYSDAHMDPWTLDAQPSTPGELSFSWDNTTGRNGDVRHLTITVLKVNQYSAESFFITSLTNATDNFWIGLVGN